MDPATTSPPLAQADVAQADVARADVASKQFRLGTHRTVAPEDTLARVLPLSQRMGITRLGNITGLDVLGIPVCVAFRPNSRSLAVFQGKGLSLAAAKVSALMEAAEVFHAETIDKPLHVATYGEIAARASAVDPELLPRPRDSADATTARFLWIEGRDLASDETVWLPYEVVSADYAFPQLPGTALFSATTNGLGAGNHRLEAIAHGLYETVERDAIALWRIGGGAGRATSRIDLATVDSPVVRDVIAQFERARVRLGVWDATSDLGVPVFACLALDEMPAGTDAEIGTGCHPDREVALLRALTEAAQARTTFIAGSRDDFDPAAFDETARSARTMAAQRWLAAPAARSWRTVPSFAGDSIAADVAAVLERLRRRGIDRVIWVDLSKPDIGVPVVRVVVPRLEGPHQADCRPGPRARAIAQR